METAGGVISAMPLGIWQEIVLVKRVEVEGKVTGKARIWERLQALSISKPVPMTQQFVNHLWVSSSRTWMSVVKPEQSELSKSMRPSREKGFWS